MKHFKTISGVPYGASTNNIKRVIYGKDYIDNSNTDMKPEYSRRIFYSGQSLPDTSKTFYTMDHRNIVTPIGHKLDITDNYSKVNDLINLLNIPDGKLDSAYGIYILEEYAIKDNYGSNLESLYNYYSNNNRIEHSQGVINNISQAISNNLTGRSTRKILNSFSFTVLTFIPESEIITNSVVYVDNVDLLITHDVPDSHTVHPRSNVYRNSDVFIKTSKNSFNNVISIELVDNLNYTNKPYYIMIGNKVTTIKSIKNPEKESGCLIMSSTDKSIVEDLYVNLNDIESIGIYEDANKCKYHGDMANKLEEKKLAVTIDKLNNDIDKLKSDKDSSEAQYEHEITKRKYEIDSVKIKHDTDINKYKHELSLISDKYDYETKKHEYELSDMVTKHQQDIKVLNSKIKMIKIEQQAKLKIIASDLVENVYNKTFNIITQYIKFKDMRTKGQFDIQQAMLDMEASKAKYKSDRELAKYKLKNEEIKLGNNTTSSVVGLIKNII